MTSSDELQTALDHIDSALEIVSARANEIAFQPGLPTSHVQIGKVEEFLRQAALGLAREKNSLSYDERRTR